MRHIITIAKTTKTMLISGSYIFLIVGMIRLINTLGQTVLLKCIRSRWKIVTLDNMVISNNEFISNKLSLNFPCRRWKWYYSFYKSPTNICQNVLVNTSYMKQDFVYQGLELYVEQVIESNDKLYKYSLKSMVVESMTNLKILYISI